MKYPVFTESQKFNQWWLWSLLFLTWVFCFVGIYYPTLLGMPQSGYSIDSFLIISAVIMLTSMFIYMITLKTRIDEKGIMVRFYPLIRKEFPWDDIKEFKVLDYGFVGGWGIRLWTKYGTVYNIRGRMGLAIELMNGKKTLIGTQNDEEMIRVLNSYSRKKK